MLTALIPDVMFPVLFSFAIDFSLSFVFKHLLPRPGDWSRLFKTLSSCVVRSLLC